MSICATGMLFMPSDSISEQLQPAALVCCLVSSKGLGPSAESHLPSAFIFPPVGWQVQGWLCITMDCAVHLTGNYTALVARVVLAALGKAAIPSHL